jgi:hypothetical protein
MLILYSFCHLFQIVAMFSLLSVLKAQIAKGSKAKIQIVVQMGNEYRQFLVPSNTKVGNLRSLIAKQRQRRTKSAFSIAMRFGGKVLCDDTATLEGAGLMCGSIVECDFDTLGGAGFSNIPVEKFEPLLRRLKVDFEAWVATGSAETKDKNGNPLVWTGFSDPIQKFFKAMNIDPTKKYAEYYTKERHTVATSYVWAKTSLYKMAGIFGRRIWARSSGDGNMIF